VEHKIFIPLVLIHPQWHIDRNYWDPSGKWKMDLESAYNLDLSNKSNSASASTSTSAGKSLELTVVDHRGRQEFVEAAYSIEEYLERQPAHIAVHRAREFEATVEALKQRWTEPNFATTILPTPPLSFRTQFLTKHGHATTRDPHIRQKRQQIGAEVIEAALERQQAIDKAVEILQQETQKVIVLSAQEEAEIESQLTQLTEEEMAEIEERLV
jgi:hypothetical protein